MTAVTQTERLPILSTGSLQQYLDSVQRHPLLSRKEEIDLFLRFQEHDDLEAARKIVMSNLRYVVYIARGYGGYGLPLEDIIQQGNVGLMKSVKKFDLSRNVRLVSFAVHWIKAEIHEYILKNWKIVKVATTKAQRKLFFNLRKAKQRLGWFSQAEVEQVASDLGVKPKEVMEMEARLSGFDESFDSSDHDDEDSNYAPASYLTAGEVDDPAQLLANEQTNDLKHSGLMDAVDSLDERSKDIVQQRWLSEKKVSLKELSLKYGVSLERIRQVEAKAFEKMQPFLAVA